MEEKAIGLKVRSQDREVNAFKYPDSPRGLYEKGVGLILRPTGQIARAEVACKDLVTRYFAYGVPSIAGLSVVAHLIAGRWARVHFASVRYRQLAQSHGNTRESTEFQKAASPDFTIRVLLPYSTLD